MQPMKAAIYTKYGPPEVLHIKEVPRPTPSPDEVLIQVHASTVNRTDCGFRSAKYFVSRLVTGLIKPKRTIGGSEFAGKVVEVGADVREFAVGDNAFGFDDVRGGGHAEYITERAAGPIAKMPEGSSYQQMAPAAEGATYALNIIRAAGVEKGQKVLVYGATGAIGSAAVQILKHLGAEVTAVCGTKNVALVESLGAGKVISYETEDFTRIDERFDLIIDAVGKSSYVACKTLLNATGKYCSTELGAGGQNPLLAVWFAITGSRKVIFPIPKINKEKVDYVKRLVETGAYQAVVDRIYSLEEIIAATKYVETGQKTGNVVIKVA
jgi:NADPH:quinone reductase-like Zn-dependent oxidoreductase